MPSEAVDDDAVHFGKLVDSEFPEPGLDLVPGSTDVAAESVVSWFENVVRFRVPDSPSVDKGVARGFEDVGILPDGTEGNPDGVTVRARRGHFCSQVGWCALTTRQNEISAYSPGPRQVDHQPVDAGDPSEPA